VQINKLSALAWEDIDFENKAMLVRRSAYNDRGLKTTKTDNERTVDLLPPAIEALNSQFELTGHLPVKEYDVELPGNTFRQEKLHFVFNPKVVRHQKGSDWDYYGIRGLGRIWQSMCEKSGVKHRRQYQLRHTYASWLITHTNVNISYLAKQMGHKNINMIAAIYGRWLDEANKTESERIWVELQKVKQSKYIDH
jgi:integrase